MYVKFFWVDIKCLFNTLSGIKINIEKIDVIYYDKKDIDKSHIFMLNLIILLGKFYIHKCKWFESIPNITHFMADIKIYFETLQGLSSRKTIRTMDIYKN